MRDWISILASAEPLDLAGLAARSPSASRLLQPLADYPWRDGTLLDLTQAVADRLLATPPTARPSDDPLTTPWWSPMPAAYMAAVFLHAGLPGASTPPSGRAGVMPPHGRESARTARELLREWGVAFPVREHAVALIGRQARPAGLLGSGAGAEAYMRLACSLDLGALHALKCADLAARGMDADGPAVRRAEGFRARAGELGILGRPSAPPLDAQQVAALGFDRPAELHRARNALRYFQLVGGMTEPDWVAERLRVEADRPRGRLHLLVGPAGCGKTTWAAEHLAEALTVSSDRMREELTGDPADQGQNYLVFQRCMDRVRGYLREGLEVTFDATNYSEQLRSMPVQAARWSGAEIVSYFFDVALTDVLMRNRERERSVPEGIVRKQHRLLDPPALYEADRHLAVDATGEAVQYWPTMGDAE